MHSPGIRILEAHHRRRTFPAEVNRVSRGAGVKSNGFALERFIQKSLYRVRSLAGGGVAMIGISLAQAVIAVDVGPTTERTSN